MICLTCGRILKLIMYSNSNLHKPYNVKYNDYTSIMLKELAPEDVRLNNFTNITSLPLLRDYVYYILGRSFGYGYTAAAKIRPFAAPNSIKSLYITGDTLRKPKAIEIFADYECANIGKIIYCSHNKIKLLIKSDTNTKGFAQWFSFGVRYTDTFPANIHFEIINLRKKDSFYSDSMKLMISELKNEGQ